MIKARDIVVLICFTAGYLQSLAQTSAQKRLYIPVNTIKELNIGDQVPDVIFNNLINIPKEKVHLSDFAGKLVIIDFWITSCGSCIAAFPKLDSLQSVFKDRLVILAVTYESKEKIDQFITRHAIASTIKFPIATNDSVLRKLFPHNVYPHEVWISPEGKVQSFTSSEEVNAGNITRALDHKELVVPVKKDLDMSKPLFTIDYLPSNQLVHYSILLKGRIEGVRGGNKLRRSGDIITGRAITNTPLMEMYRIAAQYIFPEFNENRIIISTPDSSGLFFTNENSDYTDWINKNLYSYDLIVPLKDTAELYNYMLEDLNKYSQYDGRIEKRTVNCLALVRTSKSDKIHTKGGTPKNELWNTQKPFFKNLPISYLIKTLNTIKDINVPIIDETNYTSNIDIEFSSLPSTLRDYTKELSRYGLDLRMTKRKINMFIITKKK